MIVARQAMMGDAIDDFLFWQPAPHAGETDYFVSEGGKLAPEIKPRFLRGAAAEWRDGKEKTVNDGDAHEDLAKLGEGVGQPLRRVHVGEAGNLRETIAGELRERRGRTVQCVV